MRSQGQEPACAGLSENAPDGGCTHGLTVPTSIYSPFQGETAALALDKSFSRDTPGSIIKDETASVFRAATRATVISHAALYAGAGATAVAAARAGSCGSL